MKLFRPFIIFSGIATLLLALVMPLSLPSSGARAADNFSATQTDAIGQIVREYLLKNPQVVREALIELDRREKMEQADRQKLAVTDNKEKIFNSPTDFVAGNPKGDVTLVEFFDYNCGFCKRALSDLNRLIKEDPNLRVVFKEFPVLSRGSAEAARFSLAAGKLGKYWDFHRNLLAARGAINGQRAIQVAEKLGLDVDKMKREAGKAETAKVISDAFHLATALGINGTPSYVVGDQVIVGAVGYNELKTKIAEARKLKASQIKQN